MEAVITREHAIKAAMMGACYVPVPGTPISKVPTGDLVWAEDNDIVSASELRGLIGSDVPLWALSGDGSGSGYGDGEEIDDELYKLLEAG